MCTVSAFSQILLMIQAYEHFELNPDTHEFELLIVAIHEERRRQGK